MEAKGMRLQGESSGTAALSHRHGGAKQTALRGAG
jgi:hypothetical protein